MLPKLKRRQSGPKISQAILLSLFAFLGEEYDLPAQPALTRLVSTAPQPYTYNDELFFQRISQNTGAVKVLVRQTVRPQQPVTDTDELKSLSGLVEDDIAQPLQVVPLVRNLQPSPWITDTEELKSLSGLVEEDVVQPLPPAILFLRNVQPLTDTDEAFFAPSGSSQGAVRFLIKQTARPQQAITDTDDVPTPAPPIRDEEVWTPLTVLVPLVNSQPISTTDELWFTPVPTRFNTGGRVQFLARSTSRPPQLYVSGEEDTFTAFGLGEDYWQRPPTLPLLTNCQPFIDQDELSIAVTSTQFNTGGSVKVLPRQLARPQQLYTETDGLWFAVAPFGLDEQDLLIAQPGSPLVKPKVLIADENITPLPEESDWADPRPFPLVVNRQPFSTDDEIAQPPAPFFLYEDEQFPGSQPLVQNQQPLTDDETNFFPPSPFFLDEDWYLPGLQAIIQNYQPVTDDDLWMLPPAPFGLDEDYGAIPGCVVILTAQSVPQLLPSSENDEWVEFVPSPPVSDRVGADGPKKKKKKRETQEELFHAIERTLLATMAGASPVVASSNVEVARTVDDTMHQLLAAAGDSYALSLRVAQLRRDVADYYRARLLDDDEDEWMIL